MTTRRSAVAAAAIAAAASIVSLSAFATAQAATPAAANGTKGTKITISDGSRYVVMNGTRVDFHTPVRDLAWNATGSKAVFVDGSGNLEIANANGTGRVVVAKHPSGQTWSHPTWQTIPAAPSGYYPNGSSIVFTAASKGVDRLERIPVTAHNGTPSLLTLGHYSGEGVPDNPTTHNDWANAGNGTAAHGALVYDNTANGEVYIRDTYLRQQGGAVTKGSQPALSADGEELVFVRSVAGHDHVFEANLDSPKPTVRDLTPHATVNYTEPAFSPDGKTVAFRAPNGTYTVPVAGSHTPHKVTAYTGLVAYRP